MYPVTEARPDFTMPLLELDHDETAAILGGFVYRGKEMPELHGTYIFADLASMSRRDWSIRSTAAMM